MLVSIKFVEYFNKIIYHFSDKVEVADPNYLFRNFFQNGYIWGFAIAIGIALIVAAVYYYGCHRSFSWAKLYLWIVVLLLSGATSYQVSLFYARKSLTKNLTTITTNLKDGVKNLAPEDKKARENEITQYGLKWTAAIEKPHEKIVKFAWTDRSHVVP